MCSACATDPIRQYIVPGSLIEQVKLAHVPSATSASSGYVLSSAKARKRSLNIHTYVDNMKDKLTTSKCEEGTHKNDGDRSHTSACQWICDPSGCEGIYIHARRRCFFLQRVTEITFVSG